MTFSNKPLITIKKSHHFITAKMKLDSHEQNLVTLLIRGVKLAADNLKFNNPSSEEIDLSHLPEIYEFGIDELSDLFGVTKRALYKTLDETTDKIMGKKITIKNSSKNEFDKLVLIPHASFKNGKLTLSVLNNTARSMLDYSKGYGEIDLRLLLSLKGSYEKRILDILSRFKNKRDYTCSLDDLCQMVGADFHSYSDFRTFRKSVIDQPLKAILKRSDGVWVTQPDYPNGYILKRKGRSYELTDTITFKMQWNEPTKKPKTKQSQLSSSTLSLDDAIKTYSELTNKVCLPSTAELNNLMSFMGQLMLEGFEFGPEFLILFKEAQDANGQLDSE
ncbi:replication initiation protein (plasmid) [Photobacterium leiognathi subsp. mandapamensis]|uniref:replication initiation protein n=1 Tax=Photobacterium leiognathi TaxID=553611 RepID=UPI003AF3BF9C